MRQIYLCSYCQHKSHVVANNVPTWILGIWWFKFHGSPNNYFSILHRLYPSPQPHWRAIGSLGVMESSIIKHRYTQARMAKLKLEVASDVSMIPLGYYCVNLNFSEFREFQFHWPCNVCVNRLHRSQRTSIQKPHIVNMLSSSSLHSSMWNIRRWNTGLLLHQEVLVHSACAPANLNCAL